MVITGIRKRPRERNRYEVMLDAKPSLQVSEVLLAKRGLYTGKTIDEETYNTLLIEDSRERAHQLSVNFISYRPRSSKEVSDKLSRKGFGAEIIHDVMTRLRDLGLLNDLEFARMFVRDKLRGKPMGRALLRRKLLDKGISFQATDLVVREYVTDENELEAATELAARKYKTSRARFDKLAPAMRQKRLADYLLNRGFSAEVAYKTARSIIR
ncbi:MAG TPA: RecX family transcriptional regulator [Bacteroidota bacterium]|nr:RecX family transcriptional regulator [Bacteroidota bacterium]